MGVIFYVVANVWDGRVGYLGTAMQYYDDRAVYDCVIYPWVIFP